MNFMLVIIKFCTIIVSTARSSEGLITWQIIQSKMPWRLVFLLGSGFAVSKGSSVSGLAMRLGLALVPLKKLPPVLMMAVVLLFVNTLTEFTSNVGTANIILPVVAHMVRRIYAKLRYQGNNCQCQFQTISKEIIFDKNIISVFIKFYNLLIK